MTTPRRTKTMAMERGLDEGFFEEATRIAKEKLGRPQPAKRRHPNFMAQINRELRADPALRAGVRHQRLVMEVTQLMYDQNYHVTRRRKMEDYLDLVWDLGFTLARRKK
jgi:hypothetical protein